MQALWIYLQVKDDGICWEITFSFVVREFSSDETLGKKKYCKENGMC